MDCDIREARRATDLATVADLVDEYETWLVDAGLIPDGQPNEFRDPASAAMFQPPGGCTLIALRGGAAAGCVGMHALDDDGECEMKRLYVRPAFRAGGIGKLLVGEVITRARAAGYTTMRLDTMPPMAGAIRMYEQFGFRPCDAYHDEHPQGAICFELRLKD